MMQMADNQTIFTSSHDFWASIYDRIEAGHTENIDASFLLIYRTIKTADAIQSNHRLTHQEKFNQERRILLSSIEHRLHGKWITIICENVEQAHRMQEHFFKLVGDLKPLLVSRSNNIDLLAKGGIKFKAVRSVENQGFDWSRLCISGSRQDIVYVMPGAIYQHYEPILAEYKRNSQVIEPNDYVKTLERYLEHVQHNRAQGFMRLEIEPK